MLFALFFTYGVFIAAPIGFLSIAWSITALSFDGAKKLLALIGPCAFFLTLVVSWNFFRLVMSC